MVFCNVGTNSALDMRSVQGAKDIGAAAVFRAFLDGELLSFKGDGRRLRRRSRARSGASCVRPPLACLKWQRLTAIIAGTLLVRLGRRSSRRRVSGGYERL